MSELGSSPRQIHPLTGLRFFAALAVLIFHYGATFATKAGIPGPIASILNNGYLGVSLFFVLSGFILAYSYQSEDFSQSTTLKRFFFSRFARIYPVYLFALALAFPTLPTALSYVDVTRVLAMVQSWTFPTDPSGYLWEMQAWTLSVEFAFYITFPVAFRTIAKLNLKSSAWLCSLLAVTIVALGTPSITPATPFLPFPGAQWVPLPLFRLVEFLFGISLCRVFLLCDEVGRRNWLTVALVIGIALVLSTGANAHWVALSTVLTGCLILELARSSSWIASFLSSPVLILLGGASYALYLLQGPIRALCGLLIPQPFDRFISPLATIVGAVVIFLFLEQPARRLLVKVFSKPASRMPTYTT